MNLEESKESYVWVCRNKKRESGNHANVLQYQKSK